MKLVTSDNQKEKRFARYKDGAELYSMSIKTFTNLAKEAKAIYKINKLVLVNLDLFDSFLEDYRIY